MLDTVIHAIQLAQISYATDRLDLQQGGVFVFTNRFAITKTSNNHISYYMKRIFTIPVPFILWHVSTSTIYIMAPILCVTYINNNSLTRVHGSVGNFEIQVMYY